MRTAYVPASSTNTIKTAAPKARKSRTATDKPQPEVVHAADVEPDAEGWMARIQSSVDGFLKSIHTPSWTRLLVCGLLGLIASGATLYFTMQMVEVMVVGTMLYTGIGFVAFTVTFIGMCVALVSAVTAGSKVFDFCMEFEYSAVKSRVSKFFDRFGSKKEGTKQ